MIKLSEEQLRRLQALEEADFVFRVHAALVAEFPDVATASLPQRLLAAHERALQFGLDSPESRTQFLYQEAFAPGFHDQPAIAAWLARPGAPAEQRWRDFMALAQARMGEP